MRPSPALLSLAAAILLSLVPPVSGAEPAAVDAATTPPVSETTPPAKPDVPDGGATADTAGEAAAVLNPPPVETAETVETTTSESEAAQQQPAPEAARTESAESTSADSVHASSDAEAAPAESPVPSPEKPATAPQENAAPAQPATSTPAPAAAAAVEVPAPAPALPPELLARLTVLENALVAQRNDQAQVYRETSRLIMFFGTACVAMGIIAMGAAVFLMHRALNSMSTISAQSLHPGVTPALQGATGGALMSPEPGRTGFDRVQASGQRFQNRMTSLEHRLEELENLAGHPHGGPTVPASTVVDEPAGSAADATPAETMPPPAPRRVVPVAAILVRKAEALANLNKLTEALTTLDEAQSIEAGNAEVHLARGRVLEKLGRLGDALASYDQAVSTDESNTNALLMKAGVLNRQERFEEALSCYERALAVHRNAN